MPTLTYRASQVGELLFTAIGQERLAKKVGKLRYDYVAPLRSDTTYFHLTHPKAGSQWVQSILVDLYRDKVVTNLPKAGSVADGLAAGTFYTSLYLSDWQLAQLGLPGEKKLFFVMRDIRDAAVSLYFSLKKSHPITDEFVTESRETLKSLSKEEGLMMLTERNVRNFARIQSSWLSRPDICFRFEDLVCNPREGLSTILRDTLDLELSDTMLNWMVEKYSFQKMSGGRKPGEENEDSHLRSGKPGNWREHFTPAVTERFKELHGQHLVNAGYETDLNW